MKLRALVSLGFAFLLAVSLPAMAHIEVFATSLTGPDEAPPNSSPGTGQALATFDFDLATLRVQVSFSGLLGTTTASHIHCCTASPAVGTANVATPVPTFPGFPLRVTSGGIGLACAPSGMATKATQENSGIITLCLLNIYKGSYWSNGCNRLTAQIGDATRKPFRVDMVTQPGYSVVILA